MSPDSDLATEGGSYFFTRTLPKDKAINRRGFVWKATHLRRLDAISYSEDLYGRTTDDLPLHARHSTPRQWEEISERPSNETIFKDGMSLFEALEHIVVYEDEYEKVMKVLREHFPDGRWPDGRRIEEIVRKK